MNLNTFSNLSQSKYNLKAQISTKKINENHYKETESDEMYLKDILKNDEKKNYIKLKENKYFLKKKEEYISRKKEYDEKMNNYKFDATNILKERKKCDLKIKQKINKKEINIVKFFQSLIANNNEVNNDTINKINKEDQETESTKKYLIINSNNLSSISKENPKDKCIQNQENNENIVHHNKIIKEIERKRATIFKPQILKTHYIPPKRQMTFLSDEIIHHYEIYIKNKQKLSQEELDSFPEFKVKDFFNYDLMKKLFKNENKKGIEKTFNIKDPQKNLKTNKKRLLLPKINNYVTLINLDYNKIDKKIQNKLQEIKENQLNYNLENYQEKIMNILKDKISNENLRNLALSFKDILEKSNIKLEGSYQRKKIKGPKTRWELTLEKIAPFIPEYLYEKLKTIK